ncbi:GAF domain-like protein, partial [Blyttiomyces helicus]
AKPAFYAQLLAEAESVLDPSLPSVANLANASALLYFALTDSPVSRPVNWVGFYLRDKKMPEKLTLGPFQGRLACTEIKLGRGVCGTAAAQNKIQLVPDVHLFPGHIACDSATESEIVVPIVAKGEDGEAVVVGVLDLDCLARDGFDEEDRVGLERIVEVIARVCSW